MVVWEANIGSNHPVSIEALAQRTDLLSVQRREALDIEIKGKEAELSQSKTLQVEIETQLKGL